MASAKMLTVIVEGSDEPLGFIEIQDKTTLADAREAILGELEGLPDHFRFLAPVPSGTFVKLSIVQEGKRLASSFGPSITIREVPPEGPGQSRTTIAVQPDVSTLQISQPTEHNTPPTVVQTVVSQVPVALQPIAASNVPVTPTASTTSETNPQPRRTSWLSSAKKSAEPRVAPQSNHVEEEEHSLKLAHNRKTHIPLDHTLNDAGVDALWEYYFEKRPINKVRLDEVPFALYSIVQERIDTSKDDFKALQALVINLGPHAFGPNDDRDEYENPKQVFLKIIKTFGPLDGLLTRITNMLKLKEYHGNITSRAAEDAVRRQPVGTYLLRLSNSSPGSLAFTVRTSESQVHNYLVERTPDFKFVLGKDTFDTIDEVIARNMKRLRFRTPCKDSPFKRTFENTDVARAYTSFEEILTIVQ